MLSPELRRTAFLWTDREQSSGYLVTPRLVLTAAHCVGEVGEQVRVQALTAGSYRSALRASDRVPFRVAARAENLLGPGSDGFALLGVEEGDPFGLEDLAPVRWGRVAGTDPLPARVFGFPELAGDDGRANLEQARGRLIPCSGAVTGEDRPGWHQAFQVESGTPLVGTGGGALWHGASGAALLVEDSLLGVLGEWQQSVDGRLRAIPVELLKDQDDFLDLLAKDRAGPVVFEPLWRGRQVLDPAYNRLPESWSAADLLRARYQVVRFCGREEELDRLMTWCTDPAPQVSLRFLVGNPAVGKTRLARELCARMAGQGWVAGQLGPLVTDVSGLMKLAEDRLVVVDDADNKVGQLDALLRHRGGSGRVRVLAIARHEGEWWHAFSRRFVELTEDALFPVEGPEPAAREHIYRQAYDTFLDKDREVHEKARGSAPGGEPSADLGDRDFANCLFILILALIDVRRAWDPEWSATLRGGAASREEALYEWALDLERKDWVDHAGPAGLPTDRMLLDRVVAVSSLAHAGGKSDGERETAAARLLRLVPDLEDANEQILRRFVRFFQERISAYGTLRPLRPMRLAQHLVSSMVRDFPELVSRLLALDHVRSSEDAAQQALLTLQTMNAAVFGEEPDTPSDPDLHKALREALAAHAPALIRLVRKVMENRDSPTGRSLAAALESVFRRMPADRFTAEAARELEEASPDMLETLAIELRRKALEYYRSQPSQDHRTRYELGTQNRLLSRVLAEAGQRREAYECAWDAVLLFNALVRTDDSYEYSLGKAHALSNLGVRNREVGRFTESLEAARESVQVYERLRHDHPDRVHHRYLSQAMGNLSDSLAVLGRWHEALEYALDARDLPPESAGPPLAACEVTEAKALALRVLARRQADAQRYEEAISSAIEARDLLHDLKPQRSGRWDRDYALALAVLGRRYIEAEQYPLAIETLSQALQEYEGLEHVYQEAERPQHADVLRDLALAHLRKARDGAGRGSGKCVSVGIRWAEQAREYHDLMAPEDRTARRQSKARTLCVLAELELAGRKPRARQARDHAREALDILEKCAPAATWRDKQWTAQLAAVYGTALARCGDLPAATEQHKRAAGLCQDLREEEPDRQFHDLEDKLADLEDCMGRTSVPFVRRPRGVLSTR
ncbi:hypothetical protein DI272_15575 [Streptomyces sp. Act143]|uniref:trypsin-like peptidase domain-containing protein n=1 Tax=Streptomyces sp. Act143 TaxID=2200760 RepID=UPI000D68157E|nr:trypsin-like peptidase domain-containing protein [Streptomyces sp. Act143]PWI15429.1 hypothetical protein DI272_15575 [Streptomyces sp. Act143]